MGIHVSWANEQRAVMLWQFDPAWTWADWHAATELAVKLRHDSPSQPRVVVVVDFGGTRVYPRNALSQARRSADRIDPRDVVILVGDTFVHFLASTFRELYPGLNNCFYVVNTLDEAASLARSLLAAPAG